MKTTLVSSIVHHGRGLGAQTLGEAISNNKTKHKRSGKALVDGLSADCRNGNHSHCNSLNCKCKVCNHDEGLE